MSEDIKQAFAASHPNATLIAESLSACPVCKRPEMMFFQDHTGSVHDHYPRVGLLDFEVAYWLTGKLQCPSCGHVHEGSMQVSKKWAVEFSKIHVLETRKASIWNTPTEA